MIQENKPEQPDEEPDPNKTFYSDDLLKAFYLILKQIPGGIIMNRPTLDQVPKDYLEKLICGYDEQMKGLRIQVKPKRIRKIIKPGNRILRA